LYVDLGNGNAVNYTFRDIPEVEGEVFGDKNSLFVRWCIVGTTGNGTVWKDVGVVFITSIVECGRDLDSEGEDASNDLNGRDRDREGMRGNAYKPTSTLRISHCRRGREELLEV